LYWAPDRPEKQLLSKVYVRKREFLFLNGDDPEIRTILENAGEKKLTRIIGKHDTIFIDEAQRIKDIGLISKISSRQVEKEATCDQWIFFSGIIK
jgi:uncharacterized protein